MLSGTAAQETLTHSHSKERDGAFRFPPLVSLWPVGSASQESYRVRNCALKQEFHTTSAACIIFVQPPGTIAV